MGGTLVPIDRAVTPRFAVVALKDPMGANLDRIQIVKGWRDRKGALHEKVYDVALSDGRKAGKNGKVKPLQSTADARTATYTNTVGEPQLRAYWQDPKFDARENAFYYARVLEIPTPRWTRYDAVRLGAEIPKAAPDEIQDRAYTSPIWFTAKAR